MGRAMRKRVFGVFQKVYTSISRRVDDAAADQGIHFLTILRAQPMCFVQSWIEKILKFIIGNTINAKKNKYDVISAYH